MEKEEGVEDAGRRKTSCTVSAVRCLTDDTAKVRGAARSDDDTIEAEDETEADVGETDVGGEEESRGVMRLIVKIGGDRGRRDDMEDDELAMTRGSGGFMFKVDV